MIVWIIGLSGAGKTTIGRALHEQWKGEDAATVLLDGDQVRRIFGQDRSVADYSIEGRRRNAERLYEFCLWLDAERINVVCCVLSLFPDMQARNRATFSDYYEVFVDVPVDVLVSRDDKGLYAPAIAGRSTNVVGVDIDFPRPLGADLVIDNRTFATPPEDLARLILDGMRAERRASQ